MVFAYVEFPPRELRQCPGCRRAEHIREIRTPEEVHLPQSHLAEKGPEESVWYCEQCGIVSYQGVAECRLTGARGVVSEKIGRAREIGVYSEPANLFRSRAFN